jgi:hypothetical protein
VEVVAALADAKGIEIKTHDFEALTGKHCAEIFVSEGLVFCLEMIVSKGLIMHAPSSKYKFLEVLARSMEFGPRCVQLILAVRTDHGIIG